MLPLVRAFLLVALSGSAPVVLAAPRLTVIDLRGATDAPIATLVDINDAGVAIGTNYFEEGARPFIYSAAGGLQDFGALIGAAPTDGLGLRDINHAGQVVGEWNARPFVYAAATGLQFLGPPVAGAHDINEAGQVVIRRVTPAGAHSALYTPGSGETVLPISLAFNGGGLNDAGVTAGITVPGDGSAHHAATYSPGAGVQDLGLLPGQVSSVAQDINNAGTVVGYGDMADAEAGMHVRPFRYTAEGGMVDLLQGGPAPGTVTAAVSVDDRGLVQGYFHDPLGEGLPRAFIYHDSFGLFDANALLSASDAATWHLQHVGVFNSSGVAAAYALIDGHPQLALVRISAPVPEPAAWLLALVGVPWLRRCCVRGLAGRSPVVPVPAGSG